MCYTHSHHFFLNILTLNSYEHTCFSPVRSCRFAPRLQVLWHLESSAAVPFGTLVALIALWFCVSVPLTFLGSYMAFKKAPIEAVG